MRRAFAFATLLLAACADEPDFDERYEKAGADIRAKAEAIDAQLEGKGEPAGKAGPASEAD